MSAPVHALVPAAGSGERFGSDRPKVLLEVAGRTLLSHALERLLAGGVDHCWIALPAEHLESGRVLSLAGVTGEQDRLHFLVGGRDRQESVERCLAREAENGGEAAGADPLVLVHDGARAAVDPRDVEATIAAARKHGAAVLGRAVTDTVKRRSGPWIASTVDRSDLFRAETPQAAWRSLLEAALARARVNGFRGTDESSLLEAAEIPVRAVEAKSPNPKLTYPADLARIRTLLEDPSLTSLRERVGASP